MMHPSTELRYINPDIGLGVFATSAIPLGTIVYVQDSLDITISESDYNSMDDQMKKKVDHYSFIDQQGIRVLCWDHAKYVNHCCHPNTISTGYGFEIAIKNISPGEQITDDYGLFNVSYETEFFCEIRECRKKVLQNDLIKYHPEWDRLIIESLRFVDKVPQELLPYIEPKTREQLFSYISGASEYISVLNTRYLRN